MNQTSTDLTVHLIVQGLLKEGSCRSEKPELTHHALRLNQYILVVKTQEMRLPLHYTDDESKCSCGGRYKCTAGQIEDS